MVGRDSNRSSGDQLTPTNFNAAIGPSPAQRRVAIIKESHNLHTPQWRNIPQLDKPMQDSPDTISTRRS